MDFASNLIWFVLSSAALASVCLQVRRGTKAYRGGQALVAAVALAVILLPALSITDDRLEEQQATLPVAAQTWHLASAGASVGTVLAAAAVLLLCMSCAQGEADQGQDRESPVSRYAAWLTRAQRLRPPPEPLQS